MRRPSMPLAVATADLSARCARRARDAWSRFETVLRRRIAMAQFPCPVRATYDEFLARGIGRVLRAAPPIWWPGGGDSRGQWIRFGGASGSAFVVRETRSPAQCRARDLTYTGRVLVSVFAQGARGDVGDVEEVVAEGVCICEVPIMIGCGTLGVTPAPGNCSNLDSATGCFITDGVTMSVPNTASVLPEIVIENSRGRHTFSTLSGDLVVRVGARRSERKPDTGVLAELYMCVAPRSRPDAPLRRRHSRVPLIVAMRCLECMAANLVVSDMAIARYVSACSCGRVSVRDAALALRLSFAAAVPFSSRELAADEVARILGVPADTAIDAIRACIPSAHSDAERVATLCRVASHIIILCTIGDAVASVPTDRGPRDVHTNPYARVITAAARVEDAMTRAWRDASQRVTGAVADLGLSTPTDLLAAIENAVAENEPVCTATIAQVLIDHVVVVPHDTHHACAAAACDIRGDDGSRPGPHPAHFGFVCPLDDAFASSVALTQRPADNMRRALRAAGAIALDRVDTDAGYMTPVLVDGVVAAFAERPDRVVDALRSARRLASVDAHVGVSWTVGAPVCVRTCPGRLVRPLVERRGGAIEFLDVCEVADSVVVSGIDKTHSEIDDTALFSRHALTSIPFAATVPVRNAFAACAAARACTVVRPPARARSGSVLHYGERPLITSQVPNTEREPHGVNTLVAIGAFGGFGPSAVILNDAAVARGLFACTRVTTVRCDERSDTSGAFRNPVDAAVPPAARSYAHLHPSGVARVGSRVRPGDAVIGRVSRTVDMDTVDMDTSVLAREGGTVAAADVWNSAANGHERHAVVRIHDHHAPGPGDRIAARFGAWGVCASVVRCEDMPVTADGLVPDMLINEAALPLDAPFALMLEGILARRACVQPSGTDVSHHVCDDVAFDGRTGRMLETTLFTAPVFHMLQDAPRLGERDVSETPGELWGDEHTHACLAKGLSATVRELGSGPRIPGARLCNGRVAIPRALEGTVPLCEVAGDALTIPCTTAQTPVRFAQIQQAAAGCGVGIDAMP